MTDFEDDLRRTLRRREPPRDLTAGILARVENGRAAGFNWRGIVGAAAAAVLVSAGLSAGLYRHREIQKGEEAKRQVLMALEITAQKLGAVEHKIDELNKRSIDHDR